MQVEENTTVRTWGEKVGFFVGFFLFSSIFYLILRLLDKIPVYVRYAHIVTGVLVVYLIGWILKVLLEK